MENFSPLFLPHILNKD
jgi:MYB-related transcription factor LHY